VEVRPNRQSAVALILTIFAVGVAIAIELYRNGDSRSWIGGRDLGDAANRWAFALFVILGFLVLLWRECCVALGRGPNVIRLSVEGFEYRNLFFPRRVFSYHWSDIDGFSVLVRQHHAIPTLTERLNAVMVDLRSDAPVLARAVFSAEDFAVDVGATPAASTEILTAFLNDVRGSALHARQYGGKAAIPVPRGLRVVELDPISGKKIGDGLGRKKLTPTRFGSPLSSGGE
jgi:hypothetical protein